MTAKICKKLEYRLQSWKEKAVERNREIRKLKRRNKEIIKSRALAQEKWRREKSRCLELEAKVRELENGLGSLGSLGSLGKESESVKGHSYDLETIALCLTIKESGSMSFRTCRAVILSLCLYFGIKMKVPCADTIRNWSLKYGCHNLENLEKHELDNSEYVLIIDESFSIGRQSVLLILGVKLSAYKFQKSLNMADTKVLSLEVKKSWTSEDISEQIRLLTDMGYKIAYSCTDGGNNIVKSMRDSKIERLYDCTHALGLLVKKEYKGKERFKLFLSKYALLNRQNYMGQDAFICPPKLRGKCRFLNIYPVANWAKKHQDLVRKLSNKIRNNDEERIYQKLFWIASFSDLIDELVQVSSLLKAAFKILKIEGLSEKSIKKVDELVGASQAPLFLRQGIRVWIKNNNGLLSEYNQLICCSDIIESFFGKFKYEQTKNPNKGITIGCLNLVNYGKQMDKKKVKNAMEEIRIVDLKEWKEKRNLKSFNDKKREILEKVG